MDSDSEEETNGFQETITTSVQVHEYKSVPSTSQNTSMVKMPIKTESSVQEVDSNEEDFIGFVEEFPVYIEQEVEVAEDSNSAPSNSDMSKKDRELSQYNKKMILKFLKNYGPGYAGLTFLENKFPGIPREIISDFINKQAIRSQMNVKEECNEAGISEFTNAESWVEVIKEQNLQEECKSEIAVVLKAIAEVEVHLETHEANGIDFKKLYKFLSEVMIGQPSSIPEGPTADFLEEVIDELLEEVRGDKGALEKIRSSLRDNSKGKTLNDLFQRSLDPFLLEDV